MLSFICFFFTFFPSNYCASNKFKLPPLSPPSTNIYGNTNSEFETRTFKTVEKFNCVCHSKKIGCLHKETNGTEKCRPTIILYIVRVPLCLLSRYYFLAALVATKRNQFVPREKEQTMFSRGKTNVKSDLIK